MTRPRDQYTVTAKGHEYLIQAPSDFMPEARSNRVDLRLTDAGMAAIAVHPLIWKNPFGTGAK